VRALKRPKPILQPKLQLQPEFNLAKNPLPILGEGSWQCVRNALG
jgi:hypothetical protein